MNCLLILGEGGGSWDTFALELMGNWLRFLYPLIGRLSN